MTKTYLQMLEKWRESLKEQWSLGSFQSDDPYVTANANAQSLGKVELLRQLSELDYLQFTEALSDDDQQIRSPSAGQGGFSPPV